MLNEHKVKGRGQQKIWPEYKQGKVQGTNFFIAFPSLGFNKMLKDF